MRLFYALAASLLVLGSSAARAADYQLDAAHTGVYFKIQHLQFSYTFGRFNDVAGSFTFDADRLGDAKFSFALQADSIDTGNEKRDNHLRGPDFFNAKQFPVITFTSTQIQAADEPGHYRLTGDLTLHGQTKPVTLTLHKLGQGADPWGKERIGFDTKFALKRSDFGMDQMLNAVGDEVTLHVSFEGIKQ